MEARKDGKRARKQPDKLADGQLPDWLLKFCNAISAGLNAHLKIAKKHYRTTNLGERIHTAKRGIC